MEVVLGLDIGTSSLKVTALDIKSGKTVANRRIDYENCEITPGVVPASMYEKVLLNTLNALSNEFNILSIGLSFQMYSLCEETPNGVIVHQWNSLWPKDIRIEGCLKRYMEKSGCPLDTLYPAYKLSSATNHKERKFMPYGLKEHIMKFLTGKLVTDYSCASGSGLMDIYKKEWNKDLLQFLGFTVEDMPAIIKFNTKAGVINVQGCNLTGKEVYLAPGLGDGMSASYACTDITDICANVGTSMAARAFVKDKDFKYTQKTWAYIIDDSTYIVGGISSNGCSVLNWAKEMDLFKESGTTDDDAADNDIMFFPWLHGERTPYWSSNLRGTFTGIGINTNKEAINKAIVKGVGFTVANLIELVVENTGNSKMIIVAGGGVHKKILMDVLAGCVPVDIGILNDFDYLASYGAAICGAEAIGIKVKKNISVREVINPNYKLRNEYKKWLERANVLNSYYERTIL